MEMAQKKVLPAPLPVPQPVRALAAAKDGRIDLRELKSQMEKRLGPERFRRYFSYFNGYLSQKLSKSEFDKLCFLTLGKENLPLHNRLILSILHNACQATGPPPPVSSVLMKKASQTAEGFQLGPAHCNGDVVPRTGAVGVQDRHRPFGPHGRLDVVGNHSMVGHEEAAVRENGALSHHDLKRPMRLQQCDNAEPPAKQSRVEKIPLADGNVYLQGRRAINAVAVDPCDSTRHPLRAPLGIPFFPASVGGARKSLPQVTSVGSDRFSSCYECLELCHSEVLRRRMKKIAEAQGLAGVTTECADLLNNGLDVYLKQLILSCVDLVGVRSRNGSASETAYKLQTQKPINGVWLPPNHLQVPGGSGPSTVTEGNRNQHLISFQDFKLAMELNPKQLGEDWPVLLERIGLSSSEEKD